MDLESLKYFKDASRLGSLAKAAKANFISQPAVSVSIKKLEEEMGGKIFLRTPHGLELTSLGEKLSKLAQELDEIILQISKLKSQNHGSASGSIRVGAVYSLGLFTLNDLCLAFMKKYPRITLSLQFLTNAQGIRALQKEEIDVFFAVTQKVPKSLKCLPCGKEALVAVFSSVDTTPYESTKMNVTSLPSDSYIAFNSELPTQKIVDTILKQEKSNLKPAHRFDNVELIKRAVQAGLGYAIVPISTVKQEVQEGKLSFKKLNHPGFYREAVAMIRSENHRNSALITFIRFGQKHLFPHP